MECAQAFKLDQVGFLCEIYARPRDFLYPWPHGDSGIIPVSWGCSTTLPAIQKMMIFNANHSFPLFLVLNFF